MLGTTGLHNLRVDCIVGVYPHEREATQPVFLDVELDYDFAAASRTDDISSAVDYDFVARHVTGLIQERRFQLIEAMAEAVAAMLLEAVPQVEAVRLEVRKPGAVPAADYTIARVERVRVRGSAAGPGA